MDMEKIDRERRLSLGTVQLYTHGFKVIPKDPRIAVICRRVLNEWCTFKQVKEKNQYGEMVIQDKIEHMYGAWLKDEGSFWFHKGQIRQLDMELRTFSLTLDDLNIEKMEVYTPGKMKYSLLPGRVLRDYQDEAKDFALEPLQETDFFSKLIAMPTGTGKTVTLCGIAAENTQRFVVGVLPKFREKWKGDIVDNLDLKPKDVMLIENIDQLRGVIDMCVTQGTKRLPPVLIITLSTMRIFIKKYEDDPEECRVDMGCIPTELWRILDCGIFAIDEAHEHLHLVFKTTMYLHGPKFIALSGTMRTEDDFQEKVQNTIFPKIKRFLKVKMEKYIDVEFIGYSFNRELLPKIRYQVFGRKDYSHTTMEGSISKRPEILRDYIQMVDDLLVHSYIPNRTPGEKAGIYVATVEMADNFITYLMLRHPSLNIVRYCAGEGDEYDDLMKCDVYVSTIQSAGTALDIPLLTDVVCTTMVNSSKSNIQVLGRLRKLANGRKVTMYMPFCRQIPKHVKYTQFRQEIFKNITKSIKTFLYDKVLGGLARFFNGAR